MPEIASLVAAVLVVTQFVKTALAKINVTIGGAYAVVLSVVASIGVVAYFAITTGTPFTFGLIPLVIQVAIAANAGYSLIKVARPPTP